MLNLPLFNDNLFGFGLDISDKNIKAVQVVPTEKGRYKIRAWGSVELEPGAINAGIIKKPDTVSAAIQEIATNSNGFISSKFVAASLPEASTFLKVVSINKPSQTKQDEQISLTSIVEEALPKEIPLEIGNVIYDFEIVRELSNQYEILLGVAPKDIVGQYKDVITQAGYIPHTLEIEAQPIARAVIPQAPRKKIELKHFLRKKKKKSTSSPTNEPPPVIVVNLGATRSSMMVYHKGSIQLTRSFALSGDQMTNAIAEKLSLSIKKAEQAKIVCGIDPKKCKGKVNPILKKWSEDLVREISETIEYYNSTLQTTNKQKQVCKKVVLCGGTAALAGLTAHVSLSLSVPVEQASPLRSIEGMAPHVSVIPPRTVLSYTTAIGLALRAASM